MTNPPLDSFRGQSRSRNTAPFDMVGIGVGMVFYQYTIVTLTLSFWDIQLVMPMSIYIADHCKKITPLTIQWPWSPAYGSLKVIGTDTCTSDITFLLLTFHSNHRLIWYHFRDKRWFQSKIAKFSHSVYFASSLTRFPYRRAESETRIMRLTGRERSLAISSASGYNAPTCQTDRRTDTGRQQRPRLHIASRGKNHHIRHEYTS